MEDFKFLGSAWAVLNSLDLKSSGEKNGVGGWGKQNLCAVGEASENQE